MSDVNTADDETIAQRIEALAYEVIFLLLGLVYTFWHYLVRPKQFKRIIENSETEEHPEKKTRLQYALPITYAAFCMAILFLYYPAIVAYHPSGFPVLGTALNERVGFLSAFSDTIQSADLSQMVMMLLPLIVVVGLHATFVKYFLGVYHLNTTFKTQIGIDAYAGGTAVLLFCIFMSPALIRVPMQTLSMNKDSLAAEVLFIGILSLMAAAFALSTWRYLTLVRASSKAANNQMGRVVAAVTAATVLTMAAVLVVMTFWLPFLFSEG